MAPWLQPLLATASGGPEVHWGSIASPITLPAGLAEPEADTGGHVNKETIHRCPAVMAVECRWMAGAGSSMP